MLHLTCAETFKILVRQIHISIVIFSVIDSQETV